MESSRIFVRGLPPSLKEAELRQHFSSQSPITDAKFIPHRRIGYVGYKTPEAAVKAVKYFNRSFMRMSRINVELARPVDEMRAEKRRNSSSGEERPEKRREKADVKRDATNPKFEAFLDTMKASSKGKTWANEDFAAEQSSAMPTAVVDEGVDGDSDNDYQHISKKQKVSSDAASDFGGFDDAPVADGNVLEEPDSKSAEATVPQNDKQMRVTTEAAGGVGEEEGGQGHTLNDAEPPRSDADWLRSRTSRTLDLLGDDDEIKPRPVPVQQPKPAAQPSVVEHLADIAEPELVEAESATSPEEASPETPKHEANIEITDRIFVRNLPYDASEQELLAHFQPYGTVSEVSALIDLYLL